MSPETGAERSGLPAHGATRVALLGDRNPEYVTHRAIDGALANFPPWIEGAWVPTDSPEAERLEEYDGVWVLPGSPYRDNGAVFRGIRARREQRLPILGTCGGFQYMLVEFARHVAGMPSAVHAELDPDGSERVIEPLPCPLDRATATVHCTPGTRLAALCGTSGFAGFHWCGYGPAVQAVASLVAAGLVVAANAEGVGVDGVELPLSTHPFYVATGFQPQMSLAAAPALHPIIEAFLAASRERAIHRTANT